MVLDVKRNVNRLFQFITQIPINTRPINTYPTVYINLLL